MQNKKSLTVAVLFGGRSGEHEVSVITAHQAMEAIRACGHKLLPIYVTKEGSWYAGEKLFNLKAYSTKGFNPAAIEGVQRVSLSPDPSVRELLPHPESKRGFFSKPEKLWADIFLPAIHGTFGEDGTLQGLLELADVPYAGPDVLASALAMDKVAAKAVCHDAGIPVLPGVSFSRTEWRERQPEILKQAESLTYPLIVKPVSLGSSIGVKRCDNREGLTNAVETALVLDRRVLIEPALVDFIEINCSVMGPPVRASVCEQPKPTKDLLSFEDKYKRGGKGKGSKASGGMASLDRIIPAPISDELTKQVQELAIRSFNATGSSGICRIDFLYDTKLEKLYMNELNNPPGSFAFYLWEHSKISFDQLMEELIRIGLERYNAKKETMFSYEANLLTANS